MILEEPVAAVVVATAAQIPRMLLAVAPVKVEASADFSLRCLGFLLPRLPATSAAVAITVVAAIAAASRAPILHR